jgi:hypothetical protein
VVVAACASSPSSAPQTSSSASPLDKSLVVADLAPVDCLLPGQVRQLGDRTYMTARRPIKTTAADCRLRGGEYVAFDRADYKSALKVWMPAAEAGDPDAQTNVGEIFERGLGTEPNYAAALTWYRKAADAGYSRAQFNLGTMYEQGLGVEANQLEALNWYRRAWGLAADDVMFASAAKREQEALRAQLNESLQQKDAQIDLLRRQLSDLQKKLAQSSDAQGQASREASTLKTLIQQLEEQQAEDRKKLAAMPAPSTAVAQADAPIKTREPKAIPAPAPQIATSARVLKDLDFGRYFALLIGNQNYQQMESLNTPHSDVMRAKQVLEQKYGFTVLTVEDGDNVAVMQAINDLNDIVGENDNLLIFYAGHGSRLESGKNETGYWLPSNAEQPPRNTFWVPNEFVTGHLARIKAKRVLVVADSCYAGLLSTEPSFLLVGDNAPQYTNPQFLKLKLTKRSRLLLSSGGDSPVLDGGAGSHSVFARAFLDALDANAGVMGGPDLFLKIRDQVRAAAARANFSQTPEFKTIKAAGHEVGDFFFVPLGMR